MSFIMDRVQEHYQYISKDVKHDNIIGIFLTGSQNYGTDMPFSDVDTKVLVTPTLKSIYLDKTAESYTKVLPDESNEQIVVKDIRAAIKEIKKQNINMLELLYTEYCILNPVYKDIWEQLIQNRDQIVRYNPYLAVKATKGNALNSYDKLYKNDNNINQKHVANLVRYEHYLDKYINNYSYIECLRPDEDTVKYIRQIRNGDMGSTSLATIADAAATNIQQIADNYCEQHSCDIIDGKIEDFLDDIAKQFIDASFFIEYAERGDL